MSEKYILYDDKGGSDVFLCSQISAAAYFDTGRYEIGPFVISADGNSVRRLTDTDRWNIRSLADAQSGRK